jgi:tape measure domain-containing protein
MADENIDIRVRLENGRVVAAEAKAVAAGVDDIGDAAQRSGRHLGAFERAGRKISPVLYGIGAATKTAALYAGGFAGAVGAFATFTGVKFNATMEQNTVAFTQFLGNTKKAHTYLNELYKVAATTPFEFPDLVSGARRFLAFGFAAKESKQILQEVGDTAAGLGGGAEEIDRMVMAIGQMKAKGRIQTEELLQLAELGVPVFDYLSKGLKMSGDQLQSELRKGSVGFKEGLDAIRAGMRKDFGGMSKEQSKTFTGQLSTLKDNTTQMLGQLTKPLFNWLKRDVLPALNDALPGIQAWIKGAMGKLPGVFQAIKGGVESFIDALKPAQPLWENVLWPLLKGFGIGLAVSIVGGIKVAVPVFKLLMVALGAIGKVLAPFKGLFQAIGMVIGFVAVGPVLKLVSGLAKFGGIFRVVGIAARLVEVPMRLIGKAALFVAGTALRLWLRFSPIGILLRKLPSMLKVAGAGFRGFVSDAWAVISGGFAKIMGFISGLGGKFASVGKGLADKLIGGIEHAFAAGLGIAANIGDAIRNWLNDHTIFGDHIHMGMPGPVPDIDVDIPALATGGTIRSAGSVLVGERGPEILSLPMGARVDPLPRLAMEGGGGGVGFSERLIVVKVGERELGRIVERWAADRANRR